MTRRQIKSYLQTLPLAEALWWFIENVNEDDSARTELFFYLRERKRNESRSA